MDEKKLNLLKNHINDLKRQIFIGTVPDNPTRRFKVDERVKWGNHKEVYVREIHMDGLLYVVEAIDVQRGKGTPANEYHPILWMYLYKYGKNEPTRFYKADNCLVRYYNATIDSLINMVYQQGVDFDVEYQREHVWKLKDKIELINSIYNNINIGSFVFAERNVGVSIKLLEIIDGKQRLSTLCEFFEDRFKYNGVYFSELSHVDQHKFLDHSIAYGYLQNPTKEAILNTFIKLNTTGRPMNKKYIENAKKLLNNVQ